MLHIENIFLPLNFNPQLFFSGQVSQILRHEQMVVIMQDGVSRDVLAGFATQQNADRGVEIERQKNIFYMQHPKLDDTDNC